MRTHIYGDRAETVATLLTTVLPIDIRQNSDQPTNEFFFDTLGSEAVIDDEASTDLVIALRGMRGPELVMSRAAAVIVCEEDNYLVTAARTSGTTVHTVGLTTAADFAASDIDAAITGTIFTLTHGDKNYRVAVRLLGEQQVLAVVTAIAAASLIGVEIDDAISMIGAPVFAERWVMQPLNAPGGALVINDSKEANKGSMATSLKTLALFAAGGMRSVAVLGALDSTPADALDDHDSIGRLVVRLNIQKLVVVGYEARHIQVAAGLEGSWDGESVLVATPEEAYDLLSAEISDGDVVLVKSSASAGLRFFGDKLGGVSA